MDEYSRLEELLGAVIVVDWLSVILAAGLTVILTLLVD